MIVVLAVVVLALTAAAVALGAGPSGWRPGGDDACGALMSNPKAQKAMQELRAEHQKQMRAGFDMCGADPTSAEAQVALRQIRAEHRQDMQDLFKKLGIKAPVGADTQGSSSGGMMGGADPMGGWSY